MKVIKQHKSGLALVEDDDGRFLVKDGEALIQEPTTVQELARVMYEEAVAERNAIKREILARERGMFDMMQARSETLGKVSATQRKAGGRGGRGGV